jgi:hypothetical protein
MWTIEINRLAREQMYRFVVLGGDLVVRQVQMEIQRRNTVEQSQLVKVPESGKRRYLLRAFDQRRTEFVGIVHRNVERSHQRAGVLPEALLARHEPITVVEVLHLPLLHVAGEADVVMRREQ